MSETPANCAKNASSLLRALHRRRSIGGGLFRSFAHPPNDAHLRRLTLQPGGAASTAFFPSCRRPLANVTTRMLFAVATPTVMIAPIREGTLKVVCEAKSIQTMPTRAPGRAVMMMNGSLQDWKFTTMRK